MVDKILQSLVAFVHTFRMERKAVTDRGYRGKHGDPKVATPNSHDADELQTFKARARMRQEHFHSRIKRFRCLTGQFRHTQEQHV